jgi:membrane-associated phospholipid phosphatase
VSPSVMKWRNLGQGGLGFALRYAYECIANTAAHGRVWAIRKQRYNCPNFAHRQRAALHMINVAADWVTFGRFDDSVLVWLNTLTLAHPSLTKFLAWLVDTSLVKFGPFTAAIVGLWFLPGAAARERRQGLVRGVAAALLALLVGRALALGLPFRPRPFVRPELGLHESMGQGLRTWSGFPSDHAVVAFALAVAVATLAPRMGLVLITWATFVVCLPRIMLALHYPTDIIFGALFGVVVAWLCMRLPAMGRVAGRALALEGKAPAWFYACAFLLLYEITEMFDSLRYFVAKFFSLARSLIA